MKRIYLAISLIILSLGNLIAQTDPTTLISVGSDAPVFTCKTIDGKTIDIRNLRGKIIMINFFATWCGPCNKELPVLQSNIWNKYRDRSDFVLVILGRKHTEAEVRQFAEAKKFTMPFAPDPDREIFDLYATQNIPRNVIIGKNGKVIFQNTGYSDTEFRKLETFLASVLK